MVVDQPFGSAQQHTGYLPDGIGGGSITRSPLDLSAFGGGSYAPLPRHGGGGGGGSTPTGALSPLVAQDHRVSGLHTIAYLIDQFLESRDQVDSDVAAGQPQEESSLLGNYEEGGGIQAEGGGIGGIAARQPEEEGSGDYQAGGSVGGGGSSLFIQPGISHFVPPPAEEEEDWLRCLDGLANLDEDFLMPDLDLHVPAIASADTVAAYLGDGSSGGGGGSAPPPPPRDDSSADILVEIPGPAAPREGAELVHIGDTVGGASSP